MTQKPSFVETTPWSVATMPQTTATVGRHIFGVDSLRMMLNGTSKSTYPMKNLGHHSQCCS